MTNLDFKIFDKELGFYIESDQGKATIIHKKSSVELRSKVDMNIVNEIRSKYNNKNNLIEIGKIYGVSNATISRILSNKIWKI